jgi:protocatechuate 3,4-dioxygenase beta subunit
MIIQRQEDVTPVVVDAYKNIEDARLREIVASLVKHLHAFARDVHLTEEEFQNGAQIVAKLGQLSNTTHNEVVLMSGSLGFSALVCLLNNGNNGQTETQANLLGPFWRDDPPPSASGDSLVRSPTPGQGLVVHVSIEDGGGRPVAGAEVDVWHSSPEGLYENQDPAQAEMNLRGRFVSDVAGRFHFRSVKPAGYPIPVDGPVGELVRATRRHNFRPAHLHFMIHKPGFKTLISQIYSPDDEHIDSDVQFGVTRALIGNYVRHDEASPDPGFAAPWYSLDQRFVMEPGEASRPVAPIRAKTSAAMQDR